eukprot:scaffold10323_cov163-Skeletonema_dohrnii-CCMP3373.AAC.1
MSAEEVRSAAESEFLMCCASCGTAEVDDIKLKKCTACYLVKYCSIKCQREHRPRARKERLNCVTKFYSSSLRAPLWGLPHLFFAATD